MKRKIFSALLFGACLMASTSAFVSCKDYDEDIQNLQAQIDANSKAIKELQNLINSGSVITDVTSITNGVKVTLSDGKSFELTNGKDGATGAQGPQGEPGANGTVWTIGDDGYWYQDGVKTQYYALGTQGEKGDKGDQGEKGDKGDAGSDATIAGTYWLISSNTTGLELVEYKDGVATGNKMSLADLGVVVAALDKENLTLLGVSGANGPVVISLSSQLRSLVFKPYIYFDGIETIEYPWLSGNYLKNLTETSFNNYQGKTVEGCDDWVADVPTYAIGKIKAVDYHMNPANAKVEKSDVLGFATLNSDIYYTRATAPVVKYNELKYNVSDGILTAGLEIENPNLVNQTPTSQTAQQGLTVALQAKNYDENAEKITSDYALVMPVKANLLGVAWRTAPTYKKSTTQPVTGDLDCESTCGKTLVWDSPKEALRNVNGAALELYYDDMEGIKLIDWLSVHYKVEKINDRTAYAHGVILPEAMEEWNLEYEFKLVTNYTVDGNVTGDSKYAKMLDSQTGQIRACNVKADGTEDVQSATAVDREPLVQVLVKDKNTSKVVLDAYILIHITSTPLQAPDNKEVTSYDNDVQTYAWDLCDDDNLVVETNWSQFSAYILTSALNNMTKEQFDEYYVPDVTDAGGYNQVTPNTSYTLAQFKEYTQNGGPAVVPADAIGTLTYWPNTLGTTNHRFDWTLSAADIESLTHEKEPGTVVEVVRYFRFKAIAPVSPYPYVYVKVTAKVKRDPMVEKAFGVKNVNYWYAMDGNDDGLDAIIFDVKEPRDGQDIRTFSNTINSTLTPYNNGTSNVSQPAISGAYKYYFVPKTYEITALNGKTYTITPQPSASNTTWNKVIGKYCADNHTVDLTGKSTRSEFDAVINDIVNKCAIQYDATSMFSNQALYAVNSGTYTKIAILDVTTGEIALESNDVTKDVLNAIGYTPNHANINTEMRSWVGLIAQNNATCNLATRVKDATFLTSWQRPINMVPVKDAQMVDANTNGNKIYAVDLFKLFDWRGIIDAGATTDEGKMWGDNLWFWAYYGVNKIKIDVNPVNVMTNMHFGGEDGLSSYPHKLSEATTGAELYAVKADGTLESDNTQPVEITFDLSSYDLASKNTDLFNAYFNGDSNKAKMGAIYYKNNGDNVTKFTVVIPITICYTWGEFTTNIPVVIERTIQ